MIVFSLQIRHRNLVLFSLEVQHCDVIVLSLEIRYLHLCFLRTLSLMYFYMYKGKIIYKAIEVSRLINLHFPSNLNFSFRGMLLNVATSRSDQACCSVVTENSVEERSKN